jgi:hypothetical protein
MEERERKTSLLVSSLLSLKVPAGSASAHPSTLSPHPCLHVAHTLPFPVLTPPVSAMGQGLPRPPPAGLWPLAPGRSYSTEPP